MLYKILRDRCCNIIVLNVHAPTEYKNDDVKDSFYEELERVFDNFSKYHMKILLGDLNVKVVREEIFKLTIGKKRLHEINNDNGVEHGCETWSLILREEHRLRVFENRVLRRIFGPRRDEVTGEWRKLHNEEHLYSSPSIIGIIKSRRMRWAGHVTRVG
jgi:hypothetical protein